MKRKRKEFKFIALSRQNLFRTILYGFILLLAIIFRLSWGVILLLSTVTICNIFLTKKSLQNEAKYAEKIDKIEKAFGNDLTEKERKMLNRLVPRVNYEEDINKEYLENLIAKMDKEDAVYEGLIEAEEEDDDDYYDYEEPN